MGIEGVKKLVVGREFYQLDWQKFFVKAFEAYDKADGGQPIQPSMISDNFKWIYDKGFEDGHAKGTKSAEESAEFKEMVVRERRRAEKEGYNAGLTTATKEIEKKAEAEIYKRGFDDAASRYNIKYKDGFNKGKKQGEERGRIMGLGEAEKAMTAHIKKLEKEKKREEKDG